MKFTFVCGGIARQMKNRLGQNGLEFYVGNIGVRNFWLVHYQKNIYMFQIFDIKPALEYEEWNKFLFNKRQKVNTITQEAVLLIRLITEIKTILTDGEKIMKIKRQQKTYWFLKIYRKNKIQKFWISELLELKKSCIPVE